MPDGTDIEIKRGRKFDQVLNGARDVFLRDGFEGASVDDIARAAGVSKATLYSYFPDKRLLFMEMARVECARQADHVLETVDPAAPISEILSHICLQYIDLYTSEFGRNIFRVCVAESVRFPELGREFYASGPEMARSKLIALLSASIEKGELVIVDLQLAADQLIQLCKADVFDRMVFRIAEEFQADEKRRVAEGAIDTFLARYGANQT